MSDGESAAGPDRDGDGGRVLWVDPRNGVAGDMLLAALLDAGAPIAAVHTALAGLGIEPIQVELRPTRRHGLRAAQAVVRAPQSRHHRDLDTILGILAGAALPEPAREFAGAVFRRLASAEARVHGVPVSEVHFHEVGALDAVADVVGCAVALHELALLGPQVTRMVGPVAVGSGTVRAAHGLLPVPVPAVLELLTGARAPVAAHPAQMELCTPTGAALITELATGFGPLPACTPHAVGVGAGSADPPGHANVVRVLVGVAADAPGRWESGTFHRVDASIDDLDPRIWPDLLAELRAVGAADAWCTPALMPKGRPGQVLSVLAAPTELDLVCQLIFERTTTLGLRISDVRRRHLRRDTVEVSVDGHPVRVKRGYLAGRLVTVQPEYDEALAVARRTGRPVADLLAEARHLAQR